LEGKIYLSRQQVGKLLTDLIPNPLVDRKMEREQTEGEKIKESR